MLEVAKGRYAPQRYHDFIGFKVTPRLLEQAFQETYGLDLKKVFSDEDHALNSYRHAVSNLLPKATRIAWDLKKDEIQKDDPGITKRKFLYNLKRSSYEKEWGKDYKQPTFGDKCWAFIYKLLPKIGPLKVLQFKTPTPATEKCLKPALTRDAGSVSGFLKVQRETEKPELTNDNIDLGAVSGPGNTRWE